MTDPIKQLYNDLRSKGYSDSEDNLREALRDKKSASDYYRSNESNLGLDKDYFMSHVYEKSNIDIEISNKQIDIDNAKIEYKKIQDALYDNAKNNKQSPDELFQKVEELEGYISTENTNINSLKKQRSSTSKVYQNLLYPDSKLQSVIKKSGIDKQLQETDLSTQEYIRKKQEDLVQYLGEEDRNLYSVEYQINKELDNNAHIKSVIDNLSKKNKTSENDIQYLAANDALSKSDQILKDLYSFKERKEYEANIGIENAIQSEKKKRSEITESLLPSGYRDNDLVNKMINSDPKIKSDINSIDNNIRFLENKKAAILVDEKGIVSSYKPKIDAVDQLLPGISASPIVKLTAYAVAKQELLSEYKKRYDELSDSTVPDVRSSGQTENREQMDDLNAKINSITKELKELSPVVLLNRGKNASEVNKYSQSILKYYGNIAASGVYRLSQNILDTDLGYMDEKMRAEILVNSLDDAGVKGYMSEGARSDIYGDQDKISKLEAENSELIKSKVEKDTKDGRVEYWTDKTARDRYYNNLKDISNITGSLNKNEGVWIDLLGTTLRFGAETYISSLLMETGIGAMSSMAKLSKYSDRIKQAYDYLSKNKKTKAILDNISNPVKFEEAIKAGKVSRGDRYIAEATKDAINFEITGRLFSEKDISASEGFLGSIGSSAVEDITKYVGGGVTGLMNTKAKKLLGEFIKRTVGQIPAEFVEEEGEALSTTIKKAGQSDSIVSAVTDIIVNGLKGNDRWETIKEDFSRNMGYDAQKDILVATAYLSTIFGAAGTGLHARKIFFDNGGDAKMLEDMEFYLKNVKSVKYGGTTYQFTGEKWVTNKNEDVDNELASKLSKLSPDAKNGSSATIGSKTAIFANNRWETETGARLTGDDLDTIISAYKSKETAEFGFDKIDSISEGDNIVSGEGKSINGKAGDVIYADRGLTEFSTTAREGFVPVKLKYDERFIATSDGKYYRDQGSPISGSYEVKTGSEFALARAIKKATTRQGRSLRMISRLMPKMREIKKEVNGSMQRLRVILHDADSYLKQTNEASRGYYDPENHVVHINLSAATGVTSTHEVIHPYLNAMFDSDPELKTSFYNSVQDDYVALYGDVDEAIVEYATDRAIYSIVPKLDTDPTFFSKVLNTLQNYLGAKIHPDISLGSLISSISGISTEGKNPLMSMLSDVKKNAKKVDIGSFNTNTDRAVKLLGISTQDEDGMPFAKEDIDRRISESYSEMVASEDYFGDINESVYNNLAEINDERKKWIEFIDESDYPIEFKAAVLAEVLGYNYDNGYKKRGYGLVDSLNKDHVAKVFSSGSNEGILKQLHELRVKDKNKYQKIKQTESDKNLEDVNINTIENTGKLSTYRNDINLIEKLDNNQNESSLEKKLEYAKQVITGSRTIERLDQKEERGRIEGGQRNVEATIIAGTSQDASGRSESGYAESEYLKKQGYDGIKRGNEIVLFEPKKVEVKTVEQSLKETTKAETPTPKGNTSNVEEGSVGVGGDAETKQQIENFGVNKADVEPVHSVISQVFNGLKKAGLTAAKTVGDWVGIGKGEEKTYSLKINGKDTEVRSVSPEVVNGFYSPLEKIINESKQDKMPVKQWAEKYANSEEAKWTGLKEWLGQQQGSVSKAEIQQFLKDNRIQVVEVVKGEVSNFTKDDIADVKINQHGAGNWVVKTKEDGTVEFPLDKADDKAEAIEYALEQLNYDNKSKRESKPKFQQYQLEGEKENYREVLVTIPNDTKGYYALRKEFSDYSANKVPRKSGEDIVAYQDRYKKELENDKDYQALRQRMIDADKKQKEDFKSSHFDEPNILVHLRMNTRTDSEGKKVLFLEEVQSDWNKTGRTKGFANIDKLPEGYRVDEPTKFSDWTVVEPSGIDGNVQSVTVGQGKTKEQAIQRAIDNLNRRKTPAAPFVTDTNKYVSLGLKVALKEAVKQGVDKISWTNGEQQNDRYDLSKSVDGLEYQPQRDGKYDVFAHKDDNNIFYEKGIDLKRIEDVFGKDIADKISKNEGTKATYDPNKFNKRLEGDGLKVGGKGMKGFYGSPTEGSLGIVGNVAKSLFKQEPKTVTIKGGKGSIDATSVDAIWVEDNGKVLPENKREDYKFNDNEFVFTIDNNVAYRLYDKNDIKDAKNRDVYTIPRGNYFTQHSIDITPELKASVEGGQPLFKDAEAQYRIENGKNIVEAIKDFDGSPRATVALTHEVMHPTVVAIIDGAKEGNEVGKKHTKTIVDEFNKANPNNKVTAEDLIKGNDAFKEGTTTKQYRQVQEFIAKSWEKYHREGGKGFSEQFQKVLDQITKAFKAVYKSLKGEQLTPELRKMFDEILGKEAAEQSLKETPKAETLNNETKEEAQEPIQEPNEGGNKVNEPKSSKEDSPTNTDAIKETEAVHRDVKEKQGISNPNTYSKIKELEESSLKNYAEQNGLMDDLPKGEVISDGNESDIYHSEDDTKFIKVTTPNNYNSWLEMLDSISIHNSENPNMKIKILGFTINKDGEFALKTEQNKNESNNQYQKIPTTTQRYYDAGELTKTDIDQFESSVKLMSADTAYETAISIVDTISKGKDALDILDSLIDFDKSEYNMHPIVVESNNKFLSTYVMLSAIAKAKELAEKIEDKYDKEFAKSVISSIQASLGDISRQAALTLAAFNSDIVPGEAFASALLPPNSDINKKDSRNSINENGIQSTDKEELQRVSTEIRDRLKKYIDDPNGSIDDIISKLLVKISSVENNNTNISAEKYARSIGSKKADKTIEKGRDLIASALTRLKNIGFAYDPKNELDALTDLFKGAIYIASGRISKAKDYFINAIENVLGKPVSYSENKWNDIINSEEGKGIIDTARKEWAIDKLKKLKDRHQKQSDTDLYDELFARIRAIKDKEVERVVKTIEETITNLSNDPELTQKQVDVLESAILQMENENSDTDSPAYKETQDKIEELRDMVEILSGKNVISKHSPEVKRRREIRKIINSGIEDRKTTIRRIINNYIEYGSLRYTLSDMLSMILPKSAADDLENSIFEELDNIINEKRKSLNKDEKNRLTKSIKDKSAEIEQLSSKINRLNYLNASLDILADRLSDASGNEAVNLQKQIESIKEEIKSISGQEAVTSRQDILETLKNRIEFLNNIDRTDAEELELAFNIDLMRSIEENKSLRDAHKDIDKIRSKLYSEYKKAYNKSEEKRKIISNLVSQIDSIKDGTYRKKSISEKEDTDSIKKLKEELRQLKGARGVMEGLTDRWTPSKLMKAIQQGATSLTDFYSLLESNTGISPKYRKAIAYVSSMVQNATIYENGNVINTRIAQKASAIIRNIKGQMQPSLMKKIFYSLVNEWAYNSMLSHPTTTINSILGSVTGWARVSAELVYRTLNSDDRKVTVSILKKMMHNGSLAMAIGQISGRSEYAVNDYEKQIMSIGVIDRIYNDTLSGIAKDKSSTKSKIAAKILVKAFVTPVKVAMNIFAATDVFSRNAFRTWNEQWDSYDKLKEVYTTGSHLGIIDAMHDELGYKEEIIQQANIEADRIFGSNSILNSVRKKEYISKRILELREYHIRDHVLVNHAEHTAKKMLLINNPETYIGSKAYNMLQHINRNEQEVSAMAIVGMFLKNMLIPFGRSLINFSHKHTVNAIIPVSYAMSKLGINLQYGSPQYDNYLSTVKAKKEYEALYEQYISADPKMKNELKKKLDEFIGGGVYMLDHKGKERREPYTKRDLRNDFIESMIGYALAGMIFYTYDDDENDYSDIVKAPSKIRVTGSGNGILFSEQKASNYTPYSIQIKKNGTWLTIAKWPYIAPHPIFFFMGTMTDNYYNRNSNYGSTSNPVYEAMYYLSTAPLAQSSQQGLQTIANIATGISTNDADSEKLENAFATALSNVSRQIIYPGAYGFATDLIRWASNKDIVRHENPYINKLIRLPYFEPFTDLVDYSPLGRTYKTKFPIEYLRGAFEDLTPKTDIEQIEQALSSTNANNVLKYYNVGKNISDDKDGSIIIKGFPIEISEEIRHSVAIEYGTRLVEDLRSRDITSQSKDYISIRKAIYNASEKIFDEVTKEIKHVYVSQYVRSIIEPYINEEISGNYTEEELYRMSRAYRYIKINDQSKSATKVLSELGMVIHDGRILFTRKMTDEEIDNAINSLSL